MKTVFALIYIVFLTACTSVSITDRKQLMILGDDVIYPEAFKAYKDFKSKTKLIESGKEIDKINKVTNNIKTAIKNFYKSEGKKDPTSNFAWEVVLVDNKEVKNAWCMPGGKMAVYSGILEIANNEASIAALMGHEIAHAVAKHSVERASRGVLLNTGARIIDIASGGILSDINRTTGMDTVGMLAQLGIMNPFNRKQESEADYLGMIFSSLSGYDIRETVKIWERMKEFNKGKEPPQFMSTHPSSDTRIKQLNEWMNEVILDYPPLNLS